MMVIDSLNSALAEEVWQKLYTSIRAVVRRSEKEWVPADCYEVRADEQGVLLLRTSAGSIIYAEDIDDVQLYKVFLALI